MTTFGNFIRGLVWGVICGAVIIALVVLTQGCGQEMQAPPHSRLVKSVKEKGGAISEGMKEKGGAISEDARERSGAVTRKGKAIGMGMKEKQNSASESWQDCVNGGCDLREAMRGPNGKKGNSIQGERGDSGERGPRGEAGPRGDRGPVGNSEEAENGADGQSCELIRDPINCYRRGRRYKEYYNVVVKCGEDSEILATKKRWVESCEEDA